jgi:exodeoxyribonuclease VII small subunit
MSKSNKPATISTDDGPRFEATYLALGQIVAALEAGKLPLDEMVAKYEEGRLLVARAAQLLDQAELRVSKVAGNAQQGFTSTPLDSE